MKKFRPLLIAEIGLNHLGKEQILFKYLNEISKFKVDGVSIQLLNEKFYKGKFKKFYLNDDLILNFLYHSRKKFKYIGIASDNIRLISKLKNNINFIKILSKDFKNINLINHCLNEKINNIFLSTGFVNTKSSIKKTLSKIKSQNVDLIYTNLKKKNMEINLSNIQILRNEFKKNVSYGNHSNDINTIPNSVFYYPRAIFFYIKLNNNKFSFPDDKHAVELKDLKKLILKIKNNLKTI